MVRRGGRGQQGTQESGASKVKVTMNRAAFSTLQQSRISCTPRAGLKNMSCLITIPVSSTWLWRVFPIVHTVTFGLSSPNAFGLTFVFCLLPLHFPSPSFLSTSMSMCIRWCWMGERRTPLTTVLSCFPSHPSPPPRVYLRDCSCVFFCIVAFLVQIRTA